ncbi:hypothetical protein BCEP4_440003 [Burkholderia cepacia]|nr:hypothetical protein BCEP4_440003 [Burkholderia cepacia]
MTGCAWARNLSRCKIGLSRFCGGHAALRARLNEKCEVKSIKMFYVSPEPLSRLLREDYLRAELFSGLIWRFTWGKR